MAQDDTHAKRMGSHKPEGITSSGVVSFAPGTVWLQACHCRARAHIIECGSCGSVDRNPLSRGVSRHGERPTAEARGISSEPSPKTWLPRIRARVRGPFSQNNVL